MLMMVMVMMMITLAATTTAVNDDDSADNRDDDIELGSCYPIMKKYFDYFVCFYEAFINSFFFTGNYKCQCS